MHVANLIAIILCCVFIVEARVINDVNEIERINSLADGWQAGHNDRFTDVSEEQASKLLGLTEVPRQVSEAEARDVRAALWLPANFDARTRWPSCVMPIRDQGACGACWSFAATSVFSTRLCIQSDGATKIDMSPQVSINCNTANNGCSGGTLGAAWEYLKNSGTVAETAVPFIGKNAACSVSSNTRRYYAASYSRPTTVASMQQAIYNTGAIQVGMDIYSDFYSYKSGVYSRTSNSLAGGHSVYLVGWGTDTATGKDFWIGVNSWGSSWGSAGTFKIVRGVNMVNIEKGYMPVAGVVASSSIPVATTTTTTRAPTTTTTTTRAPTTTTTTTRAPTTTTTTTRAPTSTTTTRAPTTLAATKAALSTAAPTRNCWTCPAGYEHWYDLGLPEPTDKCACVKVETTKAPTSSATTQKATTVAPVRNCWTCHPGYEHWYDLGLPEPTDKCACVKVETTKAPTSAADTTQKATTVAPVRDCWTCPAGFVHWFVIGLPEPTDKCACVPNPVARNCWTCPAGFVHWYDIGLPEPTDKCACVPQP